MNRKKNLDTYMLGIIGPSGCGKSAIVRNLASRNIVTITPSWTDRPKRDYEEEVEHVFVSSEELTKAEEENRFIEVVKPFNLPYRYGMPRPIEDLKNIALMMIRAQFVPLMLKHYPNSLVYQIEASYDFAKQNVLDRNDSDIGTRLEDFNKEIARGRKYAQRVFVNKFGLLEKITQDIEYCLKQDLHTLRVG